jgi:O-antigen ligase
MRFLDGYILPQIGIASFGISLALVFLVWQGLFPLNLSCILALGFFSYLMIANSWSTVPHNSLRDVPLIFASVFSFIIASCIGSTFGNVGLVGIALAVFCVSMFTCLYGIGQRFRFDPLFHERLKSRKDAYADKPKEKIPECFQNENFVDSRAISTLGNTNYAAGFFLSTIPFLFFLSFEVSPWFLLSFLVVVGAMVATHTRAGLLSIFTIAFVGLVLASERGYLFDILFWAFGDMPILSVILLSVIIIAGGIFLLKKARKGKWLSSLSNPDDPINTTLDIEHTHQDHWVAHFRYRLRYIRAAWYLIKRKPLQGYGLRTYRKEVYYAQAMLDMQTKGEFLGYGYQTPQPREVHNDLIENFVEGGFPGGLLFLAVVGTVLYSCAGALNSGIPMMRYLAMAGMVAGIVGFLVDACFFFPLRLGPSAMMFWTSLALAQSYIAPSSVVSFGQGWMLPAFVLACLAAMNWEGVIKPNLGNWYFTKANFSQYSYNKEKYLNKAMDMCPKETIFRTHMLIGYMDSLPNESDQQAEAMRQHYDGMTPGWAMAYNSAMAAIANQRWEDAGRFLRDSLVFYPAFQPARDLMAKIWAKIPLPRERIKMKKMTDEGLTAIRAHQQRADGMQKEIQRELINVQLSIENIILNEKLRLNIPIDWPFDVQTGVFLSPREVQGDMKVIEMPSARTPVIQPKQIQQNGEQEKAA